LIKSSGPRRSADSAKSRRWQTRSSSSPLMHRDSSPAAACRSTAASALSPPATTVATMSIYERASQVRHKLFDATQDGPTGKPEIIEERVDAAGGPTTGPSRSSWSDLGTRPARRRSSPMFSARTGRWATRTRTTGSCAFHHVGRGPMVVPALRLGKLCLSVPPVAARRANNPPCGQAMADVGTNTPQETPPHGPQRLRAVARAPRRTWYRRTVLHRAPLLINPRTKTRTSPGPVCHNQPQR
jgi:hypothetical protein